VKSLGWSLNAKQSVNIKQHSANKSNCKLHLWFNPAIVTLVDL